MADKPLDDKSRRSHRKRGDGEGSITRREDGIWRGRLMVGYRPDGRPDVRDVYAKTRAAVQKKLAELRQRHEGGMLPDADTERDTLEAFLTRWLDATKANVRSNTWIRYGEYVRLHLVPTLGKTKLSGLRPEMLHRLYAAKLKEGLSPRTVHHLHTVLHTALTQAVRWGNVSRNVADAVDPPAVPRHELVPPTPAEVARLLDSANASDDRFAPMWTVAVYSGCREGELLALQWHDVNLEHGSIAVRRTLISAKGGVPQFGDPKTSRSRRTVMLPSEAIAALRLQQARQNEDRHILGVDYASYDLVFASRTGTPLMSRNVIRAFKATLARAGLSSDTRIHDLRHAAATLMLSAGVHPKVVSERLGHSTIGITMDLYTHSVEGLDVDAAARMQRAVRGDVSTTESEHSPN